MASLHTLLSSCATCFQLISGLLLCLLLLARSADAQNRTDEVQTLLSLVQEAGGGSLQQLPYWPTWDENDENACAWAGVTCTNNYTVSKLDFSRWGIDRMDNLEILSNLADLTRLDLSSNQLGSIPSDINMLSGLTWLDLSGNQMEGNFPNISSLSGLRFLSLQENNFSGQIPSLRGFPHLQFLYLSDNSLSGPLPKDLGELRNLVSLNLFNNYLNGGIPSLATLQNLASLNLDNNSFTGFEQPWLVTENSSLQYISASFNQLEGMIPSNITTLPNLAFLNLSHNQLSGDIPLGLLPLGKVGHFTLDLSSNQLTGEIPADLLQPSLYVFYLNFSHNLLGGNIPINESAGHSIVSFDLSHNNLSGPIPSNTFQLFTRTGFFGLQNNQLSGDIVDALMGVNFSDLPSEVRLQNNLFTGDLSRIASRTNESLRRSAGGLSGDGSILDLSNNFLGWTTSEANPDPIQATLEVFFNWSTVTEFRVGGNNFAGTALPTTCFLSQGEGVQSPLEVLDLSNNQLQGEISDVVFNSSCVPSLKFLNLSNNDILGQVPKSVIMIQNLAVLDVSDNHLNGSLPPIPLNSSLFNPTFFEGNDGLCGYPLPSCPPIFIPKSISKPWHVLWKALMAIVRKMVKFIKKIFGKNKMVIVMGSAIIALGSCLVTTWRWRVYQKRHQQDADLIKTLLERDSATLMSLRALEKATNNFAPDAKIGEGGFGAVYAGKLSDGTLVAIKRSKREGSQKDKEQFLNEVSILAQVNHRNLVKLLGCSMENKVACLIFEFVPNGTLQEHLQGRVGTDINLSWKQRLKIAVQTANALNYLHSLATIPIFHRDVKSANILLDEDLNAKVADFGISKLAPIKATHVSTVGMGTVGYIDPEYWATFQLSDKSDVYSFGVVLLELISAKRAVDFERDEEERSLVIFANPYIKSGDLQQLIDPSLTMTYNDPSGQGRESILNVGKLAMKCLDMQSKARPSMKEVWKQLEKFWLERNGTSMQLGFANEHDDEDPLMVSLSDSLSNYSSNSTIQNDATGIQMSPLTRSMSCK